MESFPDTSPDFCPGCGSSLSTRKEEGRERLYCGSCDRIIWRNPAPAAAVALTKGENILLVKRGIEPWKNEWSLPAGYLEIDEHPREGAVRELEEETSIKFEKKGTRAHEKYILRTP